MSDSLSHVLLIKATSDVWLQQVADRLQAETWSIQCCEDVYAGAAHLGRCRRDVLLLGRLDPLLAEQGRLVDIVQERGGRCGCFVDPADGPPVRWFRALDKGMRVFRGMADFYAWMTSGLAAEALFIDKGADRDLLEPTYRITDEELNALLGG